MAKFDTEADLLPPVARYAHRRTFRHQDAEVAFYEYLIDFYGYSTSLELTVAVELKMTRWRRAFEQALIYQLCSDLVFIAMPMERAEVVDLQSLAKNGVGLIGVRPSGSCQRLLAARCSSVVRAHYRTKHIELLQLGGLWRK